MKYVKIRSMYYSGVEPVYNMEVKKHHNFAVNFGLIVHNCYDCLGYLILSSPNSNSRPLERAESEVEKYKKFKIKKIFGTRANKKGMLN